MACAPCHPQTNAGKVHWRNTLEQLNIVGPKSLGVCLLTAAFIGMVFTIQFIRWVGNGWLEGGTRCCGTSAALLPLGLYRELGMLACAKGRARTRGMFACFFTACLSNCVFPVHCREFAKLGLTRSVGGVLGLALSRELTPVVTCIILAGGWGWGWEGGWVGG